jgi:DHA1 family inner membrane transport protein
VRYRRPPGGGADRGPARHRRRAVARLGIVFLLIAATFALAFLAIALAVPLLPGNPVAGLHAESAALRSPQVWLAVTFGVLGFGGMFAVITYISLRRAVIAGGLAPDAPVTWP